MRGTVGSGTGRRRTLPLNAEINVTSLVDVAFTLLVIFIITAPILQGGIEVTLPKAESTPITSSEGVIVTVAADGNIYLGDVPVSTLDEFESLYPDYVAEKSARGAYLKGDAGVPYGRVLQVLGRMKRLDVVDVGLVSDPELER